MELKIHPEVALEDVQAENPQAVGASSNSTPALPECISTPLPLHLSASSCGKKICILQCGSRGDSQPIIALAAHLKDVGFRILVLGTVNAVPFMQTFGVDCIAVHPDSEQHFREDKQTRDAMAKGKLLPMLNGSAARDAETWPAVITKQYEAIKAFQPDLLCSSYVDLVSAQLFASYFQIPRLMLFLQPLVPSKYKKSPFNEARFHYSCWIAAWKLKFNGYRAKKYPIIQEQLGHIIPDVLSHLWPNFESFMFEMLLDPNSPWVCGFDEGLYSKPIDWPPQLTPQRFAFSGFWVVSPSEQEKRMEQYDPAFGGTCIDDIKKFLAQGEPPIYLGWGSMIAVSPGHMIRFAVRALMTLGKRGIIVGGFAQLDSPESMKSSTENQPDELELIAYQADHVLFVRTAPHEWLFPRCAVSVHHGGAGTTGAALRSGKPTVITPCFLDQFGNAEMVEQCGCGIRCKQFIKVTVKELSCAIRKCLEDTGMQERCSAMGNRLRQADSCGNTAAFIDRFLLEEVATGRWKWRAEEQREKRRAMWKSPKDKHGLLHHMCCTSMNYP